MNYICREGTCGHLICEEGWADCNGDIELDDCESEITNDPKKFFTDYTFPETRLTVVRRKTENGFLPVTLDCGGEITGFQPVGTSGEYEFVWVALTKGSRPQAVGNGTCRYGRGEIKSDGPFGITVWGMGKDASYGYVGGMGLRPINDAPPPTVQ